MTVSRDTGRLTLTRRWWRTKHIVMIGVLGLALLALAIQWYDALSDGSLPETWIVILSIPVAFSYLTTVRMLITRTTIVVSGGQVDVRTTPFPFLISPNVTVHAGDLAQLFATRDGKFYGVSAELTSGKVVPLLRLVALPDHALAIEEQIEAALGIEDRPVHGELPRAGKRAYAHVSGARPLSASPGGVVDVPTPKAAPSGGGAFVIIPIAIAAAGIGMMMFMFTAGVEGSLSGTGASGAWTFQPDDCSSGQPLGFMGVELSSEKDPSRRIRLMKDELDRPKVAVLVQGKPPAVISAAECPGAQLSIVRTNDQTNNVYLIEGSVSADCTALKGSVKFERCGL